MPVGLALPDYVVLGICLAAMLATGAWAGRGQSTSDDFFLANRSAGWWLLGLSLAVAGLAAVYYCESPNEAYWVGLKFLLVPALVWAALPMVFWCVIPLYGNLELDSVYEYLELRFDPATRATAGGIYVLGMLLWLGGVLVLPCKVMQLGAGLNLPVLLLLVAVGTVTTLYTYLGGMKATLWTDIGQLALMAVALLLLISFVAANLDEGLPRILEAAEQLGRTNVVQPTHGWSPEWSDSAARWSVWSAGWSVWSGRWSVWSVVAYLAVVSIFFFVADQTTLQRLFAARDDWDMRLSYLLGCGLFSLMVPLAMYVGLGLLAVYHDQAQAEIPPRWVANRARDPDTGRPLVGPEVVIDAESIGRLVAEGVILDPNTNRPFADDQVEGLVNSRGQVVIDRLATRAVRIHGGERHLRAGGDELFAHFVKRHLRFGTAGVVLAALAAAVMATIDSALNSLATVLMVDFHRRFGWAEGWLARQCGKQPDELDQTDELRLGRPMVLILGAAVVVISLVVAEFGGGLGFVLRVLNIFAGPLLGVFLLGLFTRRTTGPAAVAALVLGMLTALWATFGHTAAWAPIWPFEGPQGPFWPLLFALAATLAAGYVLSFLVGSRKSRDELSGLVVGLGRLGHLLEIEEEEDEVYLIEIGDDEQGPKEDPWS